MRHTIEKDHAEQDGRITPSDKDITLRYLIRSALKVCDWHKTLSIKTL